MADILLASGRNRLPCPASCPCDVRDALLKPVTAPIASVMRAETPRFGERRTGAGECAASSSRLLSARVGPVPIGQSSTSLIATLDVAVLIAQVSGQSQLSAGACDGVRRGDRALNDRA